MNFTRICCYFLTILASHTVIAQSVITEIDSGYYAIVGTFAVQDNAIRYSRKLTARGMEAHYFYSPATSLYSVYTHYGKDRESIVAYTQQLRNDQAFADAWIKQIPSTQPAELLEPIPEPVLPTTPPEEPVDLIPMIIRVINSTNQLPVDAMITVIDEASKKNLGALTGNSMHTLPLRRRDNGDVLLVCDVFGFRKAELSLNLRAPQSPAAPELSLSGDTLVIQFDLIRYHAGDIISMYQVYFYNDATIMKPQSEYQLNQLANMMLENPHMRIRLHGHTNGNFAGKFIRPTTQTNFFSLKTDTEQIHGSARQLSHERAQIVRHYLVYRGVDPKRIELKGWAGKRALFDTYHVNAIKNLRVDVEILP